MTEPFKIESHEVYVLAEAELESAIAQELAVESTEEEDAEKLKKLLGATNEEPTTGN